MKTKLQTPQIASEKEIMNYYVWPDGNISYWWRQVRILINHQKGVELGQFKLCYWVLFLGRATASRIDICRPMVRNVLRKCPT